MDLARQDNAVILVVVFILIRSICCFHLKPLSIFTPRKTPNIFALMVWLSLRTRFVFRSAFLFRTGIPTDISMGQTWIHGGLPKLFIIDAFPLIAGSFLRCLSLLQAKTHHQ